MINLTAILTGLYAVLPEFLFGYFGGKMLDRFTMTEQDFSESLQDVIQETIVAYSDQDTRDYGRMLPFYHSSAVLAELLKFRMVSPSDYEYSALMAALENEAGVAMPGTEELSGFLDLFMDKVRSDEGLRKLEVTENFGAEIFRISDGIARLGAKIETMSQIYNGELEIQWKDRIDSYVRTLGEFRPLTALGLLEALEKSIAEGTRKPGNNFMAGLEFQKGQCLGFLQRGDESYRAKIRAYLMLPSNPKFKKNATICYFRMSDPVNSRKLALELLDADPFCPVGWAFKVLTADLPFLEALAEVPALVRNDLSFLRHLKTELEKLGGISPVEYGIVPGLERYVERPVIMENFNEVVFWLNIAVSAVYRSYFLDFTNKRPDERKEVKVLHRMLELFLAKLDGSEVPQDYTKLKYLYASTRYALSPSEDNALAMEVAVAQLASKDWFSVVQAANALQLTGQSERAVLLLSKQDELTTEGLLLLAYCYQHQGDLSAYLATVKRYAASITQFHSLQTLMFLNLVLEIKLRGELDGLTKEDFLAGKCYLEEETKQLVETFVAMLFDGADENSIPFLDAVAAALADDKLIGIIGSGFFAVGAFEVALPILARAIDPSEASRELHQYIVAQHQTGKDLNHLLSLLRQWRENLPFHGEFLRMEAFLRRDLVEWDTVVEICEQYLEVVKGDSAMLAIYLTALHSINSTAALGKIAKVADNLGQFNITVPQNAVIIANMLMVHQYYERAFELIYPFASDPKQIQVRGNYNGFVLRLPADISKTPLKEYTVVEEGHFVKYDRNGIIGYVEMNSDNIAHRVFGQFIGKAVCDKVEMHRNMVNIGDTFIIRRIMNNYLSLFDEILNQSEVDPYAGLPFQSIKFDPEHPGGILAVFEELLGGGQKIRLEDRDKNFNDYYAHQLSLSELIVSEYRDDFIQGYYNLVRLHKGISSVPRIAFESRDTDVSAGFVIDMSSLLLLHQFSRFHQVVFPAKFIISRYIVDQLRSKHTALEFRADPFDTPTYEWGRTPIDDDTFVFMEDRKLFLEELLHWIAENCSVELSGRTIEMVRGAGIEVGQNSIIDAAFSTALLVQDVPGRFLITDDLFYTRTHILSPGEITSTEDYAKRLANGDILDEFVRNRMINFAPSPAQLMDEFNKRLAGQYSRYELLLENAALINSRENLPTAINFVKLMALSQVLTAENLQKQLTQVFVSLLKTSPNTVFAPFRQSLFFSTYLLGTKMDVVMAAFDDARRIIEKDW